MSTSRYWLGLGANLGDRRRGLEGALEALRAAGEVIEAVSSLYETAPRDLGDQPSFLNAAVRVQSARGPRELLAVAKAVEQDLGRDPGGRRFGPRVIDCDLLLWDGGAWHDAALEIPHPRLTQRRFVLVPLLELDPGLVLPDGTVLARAEAVLDPVEQSVSRVDGSLWPPPAGAVHPPGGPAGTLRPRPDGSA